MKRRMLGVDLALTVTAQLAYKLLGFVILTLLARGLGPDEFGFLMFALATCELAALLTEFGSSAYLIREIAVTPVHTLRLLGEVLGIRLVAVGLYLALMAAFAVTQPPGQHETFLAIAAYCGLKELSRAYSAAFYGVRRVAMAAIPFASHLAVLAAGVWLAIGYRPGVPAVADVYLVAGLWLIGACWGQARWLGPVRPTMRVWRRVIVSSLPLFGLGLLTMIQLRIDSSPARPAAPVHRRCQLCRQRTPVRGLASHRAAADPGVPAGRRRACRGARLCRAAPLAAPSHRTRSCRRRRHGAGGGAVRRPRDRDHLWRRVRAGGRGLAPSISRRRRSFSSAPSPCSI